MGTTVTAPQYFTGLSTFSSDFQSIIQRAVSIRQLPITALQNQQTNNLNQKQALIAFNPDVASVGAAVGALGTLAANQGVAASSSDSSTVSVTNIGATAPGTYTVSNISSLATNASETSVTGYANAATTPVSQTGQVNLVVGSNNYSLNLTGKNNLNGLVNTINTAGAGVTATILHIGSLNYLSVAANNSGATTLQLNDAPLDLVTNTGTGAETSTQTYANSTTTPVSGVGNVNLVVGSTTYNLNLTGNNNLTGLMNAINSAGAPGVSAAITGSAGAYSLSMTGPAGTLALNDIPSDGNLITNTVAGQGSNAQFYLNGVSVTEASNTINDIIPGVSFSLLNTTTPATSITLSLATDPTQLSNALQQFVTSYNALVGQVAQQVGTSAGPLGGDLLISQISQDANQLSSYWNRSGSIHSLADLGVTFADLTGQMTFNPSAINGLSSTQISDAFKFLGSSNSGFAQLANNFTTLSDPLSGLILVQENGYDSENTQLARQITTLTTRASAQQAALTRQVQAADALVAQLQSQQNTVNASISSLNYVLYGKLTTANGL
ncbi:MAG TPA: flagellar filament capping protein FliD [Bryobacteraceae bacterium]|nr:flagellar filament capping protein FliD [Bryobacteraceae bacterium]